ncbi:MAG: TolC family protein [Mariniphaga sp.]
MTILKFTFTCLILVAVHSIVFSQPVFNLDLESSIALAKEKSKTMLKLKQSLAGVGYDLRAATSKFKTHVNLDLVAPRYSKTVRQFEDSLGLHFYPVSQNSMSGYLTINQPLPSDGSLFIRSGMENITDYYYGKRNSQLTSIIGLNQPIEAFFGYNNISMGYKQAKLNYDRSFKQLKRAELDLVYNISQSFFTLLSFHERLNIAKLTLQRQKEAYEIAQSKYKAGLIREVEALQMEVDLGDALNSQDIANVNYLSQVTLFKEELGMELNDSIVIKTDLDYKTVNVDAEKAVSLALENRLELKEDEINIELNNMDIKRRKAEGRINGDISFNYEFKGVNQDARSLPVETTLSNTWNDLQRRPGNLGVGLTISIPLIDWGENRARVHSAEATLNQNLIQLSGDKISIERDVRTTVNRLQSNLRRLQLLEKTVVIAEKSFEISRQRYSNGDIDSQAMALERERLNTAYVTRLDAFINYKLFLADIMRKTFYDFERDVSLLAM